MPLAAKIAPLRRRLSQYFPYFRYSFFFFLIGLGLFLLYSLAPPLLALGQKLFKPPAQALRSTNDRTNILLLGMGGEGHTGELLTDSMILISYHHPSRQLALLPIPRDLWIDSLKTKINATYFYGEQRQKDGGLILAKSAVLEAIGLPVHYALAINFEGFEKATDLVGGIDVQVERTFDDYKYPIPGMETALPEALRYQHIRFEAGLEHMDGQRALKFVRSRQAEGEEGTDFARSQRQQKVLLAFKDKLLTARTLLNPRKIQDLMNLYRQYIDTDITQSDYASLAKIALLSEKSGFQSIKIDILENPRPSRRYLNQWVLIPKDGNWQALHQYILNQLQSP